MTKWIELADALRDATGPSRELDARLAVALGWKPANLWGPTWWYTDGRRPINGLPHFTDTNHIGQIIKVIGEKLPGWGWTAGVEGADFDCLRHRGSLVCWRND